MMNWPQINWVVVGQILAVLGLGLLCWWANADDDDI